MRFLHLAPSSAERSIREAGVRAVPTRLGPDGVYCMPVLADFWTTLQWTRELRRRHDERLVAVTFRVPDRELVHVGPYRGPHTPRAASEAARWVRDNPAGAEVVLPRAVRAAEIVRVAALTQLVGWVGSPEPTTWDCVCSACLPRGLPDRIRRIRAAYERAAARARGGAEEALVALSAMEMPLEQAGGRLEPRRLLRFTRHADARVRARAAALLGWLRLRDVEVDLARLVADAAPEVRASALRSAWRGMGLQRTIDRFGEAPLLLSPLLDVVVEEVDVEAQVSALEALARRADAAEDPWVARRVATTARDLLAELGDDAQEDLRARLRAVAG